jgi:hypothetical protein
MIFFLALVFSLLLQKAGILVAPGPQQQKEPYVAPFIPMPQPPKLPKVDRGSCPFEGCQFGKWTARKAVIVYSSWRSTRRRIAELRQGEEIIALTGVNLVFQPGKGSFTRDVPLFGARKGDTLYTYQDCGEGAVDIWVRGRFIKCSDPNFSWKPGYGCQTDCNGRYLELGKSEWWAKIRLKSGRAGWVLVTDNFDGTDALA